MSDWLNRIEVASPCHESWDEMNGDQRERHCDRCEQTVYDLSGLAKTEAEDLVRRTQTGEQVCVRFRRRADGTVLTADCPSQVRKTRSRWTQVRSVAAGLFALAGGLAAGCTESDAAVTTMGTPRVQTSTSGAVPAPCCDGTGPCCEAEMMGEAEVMGDMMIAPVGTEAGCNTEPEAAPLEEQPLDLTPRLMGKVKMPSPRGRLLPAAGELERK